MRRALISITLATAVLTAGSATALEVGVRAAYWLPKFSGEFRLDGNGVQGDTVDAQDDLGMDDENFPSGEAWLWLGDHHLVLSAMRVDYSGDETLATDITFGGSVFPAGSRAKSTLEYTMVDLAYQYDLIDLENVLAGFSLGPILQVKYLDGEVKMRGEGSVGGGSVQVQASETFRIPVPLVGLGGHVGILADWLELRARAVGVTYRGDHLLDLQAELSYTPFPLLEIVAGYRYLDLDLDQDDVLLNYSQYGPFIGAGFVF